MGEHLFTSESVTEGHPDKVADQISDTVVDNILSQDPRGRVACETMVTTGMAFVSGEITTECYVDIPSLVRSTIKDIGYTDASYGFDFETCAVITSIDKQSPDIAMGVDRDGAGDQGMMFGYACRETEVFMPLPIVVAHKLTRQLAKVRKEGILEVLRPDGKSQVTVAYRDGMPDKIETVVVSTQHDDSISTEDLRNAVREKVIDPVLGELSVGSNGVTVHINPTGRFVEGGPKADCGLTGRKIIVDTYGGVGSHGGGAFSGKDPTKVDRSASYAARWVAKNLVAAGVADRCEVQLAYAIGVAEPVSIMVDTEGTSEYPDQKLVDAIRKCFDLTPRGIIDALELRRGIYRKTAAYGHFGRDEDTFTWERTNKVEDIQSNLSR